MPIKTTVAAAAVMTLQTLVLAVTSAKAEAATVYRCHETSATGGTQVQYQSSPCRLSEPAKVLQVADAPRAVAKAEPVAQQPAARKATRSGQRAPRRKAGGASAREDVSTLATGSPAQTAPRAAAPSARRPMVHHAYPTPGPRVTRATTRTRKSTRKAAREEAPAMAGALTRHRVGERPFEHLGQQVTPPLSSRRRGDERHRPFTAKAPAAPPEGTASPMRGAY